jgi:hypothetical protein
VAKEAPQQPPDMIGMVDDLELLSDDIDDPPTRPPARGVAGGFRSRHDEARQLLSLCGGQLRRSARRRACPQARAIAPPGAPASIGARNVDPRRGGRPRHARGHHAGADRSRVTAGARAPPGSPVGACTPPTGEYRTLLIQKSLARGEAQPSDPSGLELGRPGRRRRGQGSDLVGVILGTTDGLFGYPKRLIVRPTHRRQGVGQASVGERGRRFVAQGIHRLNAMIGMTTQPA